MRSLREIGNIVRLDKVFLQNDKMHLVFEYAKDGNLLEYIIEEKKVKETQAKIIIK